MSVPVASGLTYDDLHDFPTTVVEPDVAFVGPERVALLRDERYIDVAPDLVVEVSSPSTRRLDLIRKRALYEREGVPEYWFVDLDADQVDVHRLDDSGAYGTPTSLGRADALTCMAAPSFELPVGDVLDAAGTGVREW